MSSRSAADQDRTMSDTVSASAEVEASPHDVFEYVRRPANHAAISGDGSVQHPAKGPEALGPGDRFGMGMKVGVPYRITSTVVEFEADRRIAWAHFGGHRWRWEVEPASAGARVTLTYDQSTAKFPPALRLMGYPDRHRKNVEQSVANVAAHFSTS
jgi:Polyketide cyclase / dehydrase and lipid transport